MSYGLVCARPEWPGDGMILAERRANVLSTTLSFS